LAETRALHVHSPYNCWAKAGVGPRKAVSQMAEEKKAKKIWPKKKFFSIRPNLQMAES
jgi:hypothetical protein